MNEAGSDARPPGVVASCEGIICVERAPGESQDAFNRDVAKGRTIVLVFLLVIAALGGACWRIVSIW
jgi:hypothetical protein